MRLRNYKRLTLPIMIGFVIALVVKGLSVSYQHCGEVVRDTDPLSQDTYHVNAPEGQETHSNPPTDQTDTGSQYIHHGGYEPR